MRRPFQDIRRLAPTLILALKGLIPFPALVHSVHFSALFVTVILKSNYICSHSGCCTDNSGDSRGARLKLGGKENLPVFFQTENSLRQTVYYLPNIAGTMISRFHFMIYDTSEMKDCSETGNWIQPFVFTWNHQSQEMESQQMVCTHSWLVWAVILLGKWQCQRIMISSAVRKSNQYQWAEVLVLSS